MRVTGGGVAGIVVIMKKGIYLLMAVLVVSGTSCRRSDVRVVEIHVPEMKNDSCARIVSWAVGNEMSRGITHHDAKTQDSLRRRRINDMLQKGTIKTDIDARILTVEYESLTLAIKNLEYAVAKAGFSANEIPADPKAAKALPAECFK